MIVRTSLYNLYFVGCSLFSRRGQTSERTFPHHYSRDTNFKLAYICSRRICNYSHPSDFFCYFFIKNVEFRR